MTTLNAYATLAELKSYITSRNGTALPTDAADDLVLENLLKSASRFIDAKTQRQFYPTVETRYFDVPAADAIDPRLLQLNADLLEVISITNGDGTTIPSTEYSLRPRNTKPHYGIRLIDNSTFFWASDGAGDTHDVIAVTGIWGYHNRYTLAWLLGSTANEAMDASETTYTVTSGTAFAVGNLIRFDNELGYVSAVSSNDLTTTRGENYSTAATHDTAINVYIWQVMEDVKQAVLETAAQAKARRFGQSLSNTTTVTAGGIILSPRDIPASAQEFIGVHRRYV